MLETTPGRPWGIDLKDLLDVEQDMKWRYACLSTTAATTMALTTDITGAQLQRSTWNPANSQSP